MLPIAYYFTSLLQEISNRAKAWAKNETTQAPTCLLPPDSKPTINLARFDI